MAFIIAVESLIFRLLEVSTLRRTAKYYILKITTRRSKWVIAISAIVLLLVLYHSRSTSLPIISESGHTSGAVSFFNRDALGLTSVESITVHGDKGPRSSSSPRTTTLTTPGT